MPMTCHFSQGTTPGDWQNIYSVSLGSIEPDKRHQKVSSCLVSGRGSLNRLLPWSSMSGLRCLVSLVRVLPRKFHCHWVQLLLKHQHCLGWPRKSRSRHEHSSSLRESPLSLTRQCPEWEEPGTAFMSSPYYRLQR